jgi:hypothetical protein
MSITRLSAAVLLGAIALGASERAPATVQTVVRSSRNDGSDPQVTQYLVALPHIAYGGGWRTQLVVGNISSTPADVTLYYYGDNGNPLSVPFAGVSSTSTALTIPANGQQVIEPDWQTSATAEGWVGLVYSNPGVKIQGVFLWNNPAGPANVFTEAAVPIINQAGPACLIPVPGSTSYTLPFDEAGGDFSGYGYANTTDSPVTMSLTFYDPNGNVLGQYSQQLLAFAHVSFLLKNQVPSLEGQTGTVVLSGQGVVQMGFRFTPYYTFTTWQP